MGRYLEYDTSSGRIISEITSPKEPETSPGMAVIEIGWDEKIDIRRYAVRNGAVVKTAESNTEREERERLKREYGASMRRRIQSLKQEFLGALIDGNEAEIERLREEYKKLKVYE